MKKYLTLPNIFILAVCIYAIVAIERTFAVDYNGSTVKDRYIEEKALMEAEINTLNNKIHEYELQILEMRITVDNMSNAELDSTWTNIFN